MFSSVNESITSSTIFKSSPQGGLNELQTNRSFGRKPTRALDANHEKLIKKIGCNQAEKKVIWWSCLLLNLPKVMC
jgi:hypothetical protein